MQVILDYYGWQKCVEVPDPLSERLYMFNDFKMRKPIMSVDLMDPDTAIRFYLERPITTFPIYKVAG